MNHCEKCGYPVQAPSPKAPPVFKGWKRTMPNQPIKPPVVAKQQIGSPSARHDADCVGGCKGSGFVVGALDPVVRCEAA